MASPGISSFIRPVDPTRDLDSIADLVELCFATTIDADGKEYIRYLRRMANSRLYHFVYENSAQKPNAVEGFVWQEEKQIVGNLTLIPFLSEKDPHYLIANIAVHPDFRRRGIAHQLTRAALQETSRRQAGTTWLHVRDDNQAAIRLYESLGFVEKARRSTWELDPIYVQDSTVPLGIQVIPRVRSEWDHQKEWLGITYPKNLRWNLMLDEKRFTPSIWGQLRDWFTNETMLHFSLHESQVLKGVLTFEATSRRANTLWLACSPENDSDVIQQLVPVVIPHFPGTRPLAVNYPSDRGDLAFIENGWKKLNTLIWMVYLDNSESRR